MNGENRYDIIREVRSARYDEIEEITKYNPYHDSRGRFTSASGGGGISAAVAPGPGAAGSAGGATTAGTATAAGNFTPATTMEEAREYAKKQLGFSGYVDYSYSYIDPATGDQVTGSLDLDTVNSIHKQITEIQAAYPQMKGAVVNATCTTANVYAAMVHSGRNAETTLAIGAKSYKDGIDSVYAKWDQDVLDGYHPQGTTGDAILWHEYGHVYAKQANVQALGPYASTRDIMGSIGSTKAETGWKTTAAAKMQTDSSTYGSKVSGYSEKDDGELFAESFAAYNTGHSTQWTDAIIEAAGAQRKGG